jgi:hypothetical protein
MLRDVKWKGICYIKLAIMWKEVAVANLETLSQNLT